MLRIQQPDAERACEQVIARLPVLARAFEADMGTPPVGEPVGEVQQLAGRRAKGLCLGHQLPLRIRSQPADHHGPLMYINARAALKDDVPLACSSLRLGAVRRRCSVSWGASREAGTPL